jgi:hypothetical protein
VAPSEPYDFAEFAIKSSYHQSSNGWPTLSTCPCGKLAEMRATMRIALGIQLYLMASSGSKGG